MTFSGSGGTAAAIRAFRSKVIQIQRSFKAYLNWKRTIIYPWVEEYEAHHNKLVVDWDQLRREAYQKGAGSGKIKVDQDGNADPTANLNPNPNPNSNPNPWRSIQREILSVFPKKSRLQSIETRSSNSYGSCIGEGY